MARTALILSESPLHDRRAAWAAAEAVSLAEAIVDEQERAAVLSEVAVELLRETRSATLGAVERAAWALVRGPDLRVGISKGSVLGLVGSRLAEVGMVDRAWAFFEANAEPAIKVAVLGAIAREGVGRGDQAQVDSAVAQALTIAEAATTTTASTARFVFSPPPVRGSRRWLWPRRSTRGRGVSRWSQWPTAGMTASPNVHSISSGGPWLSRSSTELGCSGPSASASSMSRASIAVTP